MKPQINLYQGDCMEAMREMEDNQFDLAIVDPPYGINAGEKIRKGTKHGKSLAVSGLRYDEKEWDKKAPNKDYFSELQRVAKNQIIWGANHFIQNLHNANSSCWVVWDKENGDNGYADCELAWTSFKTAVRRIKFRWHGMLQGNMKNKEIRIHPTQKPVKLYKWLLKNYANEGDKILDTHLGSGSIAIACYDYGFDLEGYELDKDYYQAAMKRFKQHTAQTALF